MPFGCTGFPYDPVFVRYGVYIRDLYPMLALTCRGKFKDLFIFEYHREYMRPGYMRSESYPHGPNHKLALFGHKVNKLYYPYNPRTVPQQTWRGYFQTAMTNWKAFDPATKNFYEALQPWRSTYARNKYIQLFLQKARRDFY